MKSEKKREPWLDLVRAMAIMSVVLCHVADNIYPLYHIEQFSVLSKILKIEATTIFTLGRFGVPLFLFLTGYLLLKKDWKKEGSIKTFFKDKWMRLLFCSWIWFVIYNIFLLITREQSELSVGTVIKHLLFLGEVKFTHVWYLAVILGIYLFMPFVAIGLQSVDLKNLVFPLSVSFVVLFVYPLIVRVAPFFGFVGIESHASAGFISTVCVFYVICGYCFSKYKCYYKIWSFIFPILSILFLGFAVAFQLLLYKKDWLYRAWYDDLFICLMSISFFIFIMHTCKNRFKKIRIVELLSKYSFGVYLVHFMILKILLPFIRNINTCSIVKSAMLWSSVMVLSYIVVIVISKIPKVGKFILYM